jgi:Uma2 family endonuclease
MVSSVVTSTITDATARSHSLFVPGGWAAVVATPVAKKAQRYRAAGTQLVWIIWPKRQEIDVWRPGDTQPSQTLRVGETLDGSPVLPGFTSPVGDLFR